MSSNFVPRASGNLKWWLAASLLLLLISFALTSVVVPSGGLDDDAPNPVSGWVCFWITLGLARDGYVPGVLFLIPTLWIPVSFLLAGGGPIKTRIALVVSVACSLIELGAGAWVFAHGAAVSFGYLVWNAATLSQVVGFFLHLEEEQVPGPCPESAGGCEGGGPGLLAQSES